MDGQRPLPPPPPPEEKESLADDILEGADVIAAFMWGSASKRRKVYHLMETSRLPLFKIGNVWCARKSRLKQYIREQEDRNAGRPGARKPTHTSRDNRAEDLKELPDPDRDYGGILDDDGVSGGEDPLVDHEAPADNRAKANKD